MYNEYFHFSELPFSIAPDPHFMFMSTRHQEGLAHLIYGITYGGGFVALTGEVGTGKTMLCHCLLQKLPENIDIALILNPKLNAIELLATICDELRISYDLHNHSLKSLVDALNQHLLSTHASGRRTIVMIDEAQNLSLEVLEQIRLLTNLETTKIKLLQIILVGQPELKEVLNRPELRQLNQRITARYHLLPLSLNETRIYIRHRLTVCKGNPDLFSDKAIEKIYQVSKGIPRVINIVCHNALLGAYSQDSRTITPTVIKKAAKETLDYQHGNPSLIKPLLAGLAVSCLAATLYYFWPILPLKPLATNTPTVPLNTAKKVAEKAVSPQPPTVTTQILAAQAKPPEKPATPAAIKHFRTWLENPALTLNEGISQGLKLWNKNIPEGQPVDCNSAQAAGFNCQFAKGDWKDLLTNNRPAILEFPIAPDTKRYALLTGIKNGQLIFSSAGNHTFPIEDALNFWDGYYVLLWQSPIPANTLYPGQSSEHVPWLRQKLAKFDGITQDSPNPQYFDYNLKARVINFQRSRNLQQDGKVGMQTIFHLDTATGADGSPHLKQD